MQDFNETKKIKTYIVTLGSPILDMMGIADFEFIKAHNLNSEETEFDKDKNLEILNNFRFKYKLKYMIGGAGFNSMRVTNVSFLLINYDSFKINFK